MGFGKNYKLYLMKKKIRINKKIYF